MTVRIAVIVAAGWGTRFLPITKSQPKEMLPLDNKPVIQYAVEEAIASGIEQIIIVTAMGKRTIEDYFDRSFELESFLESKKETRLAEEMRRISTLANICSVRQKQQLGLGHAILTTRNIVGNQPFAVFLPDDVIHSDVPALKQLMAVHEQYKTGVVAIERIEPQDSTRYGVIEPKKVAERVYRVLIIKEKPQPAEAPSNLGVVGRYILTPEIFDALEVTPPGKNQEIQLTDALQLLLAKQAVHACEFQGIRYDTGTPLGWLEATVALALKNPALGPELREYLKKLL